MAIWGRSSSAVTTFCGSDDTNSVVSKIRGRIMMFDVFKGCTIPPKKWEVISDSQMGTRKIHWFI